MNFDKRSLSIKKFQELMRNEEEQQQNDNNILRTTRQFIVSNVFLREILNSNGKYETKLQCIKKIGVI